MQCHADNTQAGDRPEAEQDEGPLLAQHLSSRTGLCSARSGLALALHVSLFVAYALRVSLSITIVAMTNSSHSHGWSGSAPRGFYRGFAQDAPVYSWSAEIQGIVLSSFFYGYGLTQALGRYCSGLFGGKPILGSGLLLSSMLTLLMPPSAELGVSFLTGLQVLLGLAEGVIFPAQYTLWAKWAPPLECSRLMNIADAGFLLGITNAFGIVAGIIAPSAVGLPVGQDLQTGWRNAFFVSTALNLFGLIFYIAFGSGTIQDWATEDIAVQ